MLSAFLILFLLTFSFLFACVAKAKNVAVSKLMRTVEDLEQMRAMARGSDVAGASDLGAS